MRLSVVGSTEDSHEAGWALWSAFAERRGFDVYLRGSSYEVRVGAVCLFVALLIEDGGTPRKAGKAIRAMKFYFDLLVVEGKDFLEDGALCRMRRAIEPRGREAFDSRNHVVRQPITWDIVQYIREIQLGLGTVEGKMCYVAIALAYNFMWRASEFIYTKADDRSEDDVCRHEQQGTPTREGTLPQP
jgi:hypothetical protein